MTIVLSTIMTPDTTTYTGGKIRFTFDVTGLYAAGRIAILGVGVHQSAANFGTHAGWNFLGFKRHYYAGKGPQMAVYWRSMQPGDTSYFLDSGAISALDVNAAAELVIVDGVAPMIESLGSTNTGAWMYEWVPFEPDTNANSTLATGVTGQKNDVLLAFAFSNWTNFNNIVYGAGAGPAFYPHDSTAFTIANPVGFGSGSNSSAGVYSGSPYTVEIWPGRLDTSRTEQTSGVAAWIKLRERKINGGFGVNH